MTDEARGRPAELPTATPVVRSVVQETLLNATIPIACYALAKRFVSPSEFTALAFATTFPLLKSVYDVLRRHELDPIAVIVLLGILTSIAALLVGGDPRLLLIRESFLTGAFGIACLLSLILPRPIMFYVGRYFVAGHDAEQREAFNARWQIRAVRRAHRFITIVWGLIAVGEFTLRAIMVYTFSSSVVLVTSPFILGLVTVGTIVWTFWYARRVRSQTTP
jgi:hypothetical protein